MSVIIHGMEMPQRCCDCNLLNERHFTCEAFDDIRYVEKDIEIEDGRPEWCPMEECKSGYFVGEYDGYADGAPVYDMWSCSACGHYFDEFDEMPSYKYCPNCGAKMNGEGS